MKSIWKLCRDYPFSTLCIIVIWILCIIPIPETPLSEVSMIDKWTHLVMYGGLCAMIWTDRARLRLTSDRRGMVVYALLLPIVALDDAVGLVRHAQRGVAGLGCRQLGRAHRPTYRYASGSVSRQVA